MGNLLAALIPRTAMVPAVEPKNLHPDAAVVAAYEADPLNWHGPLRVRTANELLKVRGALGVRGHHFCLFHRQRQAGVSGCGPEC
jgi:hypothetical protein